MDNLSPTINNTETKKLHKHEAYIQQGEETFTYIKK